MSHPRKSLDPIIHAPTRYSILAALAAVGRAEFAYVRDTLELTDSALSKQVATLEDAGYVEAHRTFVGRRRRTYLSLTTEGRTAFDEHTRTLRAIADGTMTTD